MKKYANWMAAAGLCLPVAELAAQNPGPVAEAPKPAPQEKPERPMEKVAFLGVAVAPAEPSLGVQLGLAEGTGLVVLHVDPGSAAAGKVRDHDVLTRFNDQVLVNPEQLTVLVRNAGIGAEAKLTLIRMRNEETVTVALGEREMPKGMPGRPPFGFYGEWNPGEPWHWRHEDAIRDWREWAGELRERAEERMKEARERREQNRVPGERRADPDRGKAVRPPVVKHSTWVEDGLILNLVESGGTKRLKVEKNGEKVFEGPVDTEEQRQKVPQEYRDKLDKMSAEPAPKEQPEAGSIL